MNPAAIMYMLQILNVIPQLIATGGNVMALVNQGTVALQNMIAEKRDPTPEEWAAINSHIDQLRVILHNTPPLNPPPGG